MIDSIRTKPDWLKMLIMWVLLVLLMVGGGLGVYYRVQGVGSSTHNSALESTLASMLFVFGIYVLGLFLHGYLFGKDNSTYSTATLSNPS